MSIKMEPTITESKLRQMFSRMLRVARFDGKTFLELKNDDKATGQAVAVVALAALSYGIGFNLLFQSGNLVLPELALLVLTSMFTGLFAALVWSFTAFLVGTKLLKGVTTFWGLLRPLFFSTTPGVLFILISIPLSAASQIISAILIVWMIIGGVFAVKNAMGFSSLRSMLTYLIGFWALVAVSQLFLLR